MIGFDWLSWLRHIGLWALRERRDDDAPITYSERVRVLETASLSRKGTRFRAPLSDRVGDLLRHANVMPEAFDDLGAKTWNRTRGEPGIWKQWRWQWQCQ